jgi:nucleoside-diphosphate-sugar epimerase
MIMEKIGLFGAAGAIGQSVAAELRARRIPYRVVGRTRPSLQAAFGGDPLAEIVTWDPADPQSVRAAARGLTALVHLVGVPYHQFQLHPQVMRQVLEGAIAEQVDRLLLIGTVYPYGRPRTARVSEDHPRQPHTFKGRMRMEQEDLVLAAHASGKIKTTILRLPDFYGPDVERSFLSDPVHAAVEGRRAKLIGPIDPPHEFVYVPDVGPVLVSLLQKPEAFGRAWNLAGAGVTSQREMVNRIFAEAGSKPRLMTAGKLMLRLIGLRDPLMREMVEMHYLLTTPVLLDDSALHGLLGKVVKTPYEEGIRRTLAAARAAVAQPSASRSAAVG